MPMPGDQYRPSAHAINPFEPPIPRISEYTAQEIATLQSRLEKQLGPEYISTRPGNGGGKVPYLAAEKAINLANDVFGFNGWSSQIQNVQIDFCDETESGKISLGLSTIVRVTLKDGTFHEDVGYGHIENCKGKAAAFDKAKKEAATDALKRALRNFGNVLGMCLYDKDYLSRVTKLKVAPSKWDAANLHRHADYVPMKKEPIAQSEEKVPMRRLGSVGSVGAEFEDEFGADLFDEVELEAGHPDDATMNDPLANITPAARSRAQTPAEPLVRRPSGPPPQQPNQTPPQLQPLQQQRPNQPPPRNQPVPQPQLPHQLLPNPQLRPVPVSRQQSAPTLPPAHEVRAAGAQGSSNNAPQPIPNHAPPQHHHSSNEKPASYPQKIPQTHNQHSTPPQQTNPQIPQQNTTAPQPPPPSQPPLGFITSRAAELLHKQEPLPANLRFNPNAESPSIRKTTGVNHAVSAPVNKNLVAAGVGGAQPIRPPQAPTNFVNPAADSGRRVGLPGGGMGMSPGHNNRSAYKAPSMAGAKRSYADAVGVVGAGAVGRPPLADVSNLPVAGGEGIAEKKARIGEM